MCGVVGLFKRGDAPPPTTEDLGEMVARVRHRGPDAVGFFVDDRVGLGHARLSIIDLAGGLQPLTNEDESLWLVCNGEIFNYVELQAELRARGHYLRTGSDCETILHLYEELGPECVQRLNGQFAFALWDRPRQRLMLARDRLGIRPLFYTTTSTDLVFGSEIKALLAHTGVPRELDLVGLGEVFTCWSAVTPRTMFKGVSSLRPGHYLLASREQLQLQQYWSLQFPSVDAQPSISQAEAAEHLRALLLDATRLRLRADVPVGAYVSGGLDSAVVTALARRYTTNELQTFAVAFSDGEFDERPYQTTVAQLLGTDHHTIECHPADIARVFPDVIWHTETPLLRTAPAPLYLLSGLVRKTGFKVVLTGEGSDEFLLGYDIFKEARVRAFWAREPTSTLRPRLLRRLYEHIPDLARPSQAYLEAFFGVGLDRVGAPDFTHMLRWQNTARLQRYFTPTVQADLTAQVSADMQLLMAQQAPAWDVLGRAQFNEVMTFLEPYLLSSQGDRVAMAHSVEGRFPFLDYRVVEFSNSLPARLKLRGLHEKALLKDAVTDLLPASILHRRKQPYRAPIRAVFAGPDAPEYVNDVLDPAHVAADGVFKPEAVRWLYERARTPRRFGEIENMALVGIISFGLFKHAFLDSFERREPCSLADVAMVADLRGVNTHQVHVGSIS